MLIRVVSDKDSRGPKDPWLSAPYREGPFLYSTEYGVHAQPKNPFFFPFFFLVSRHLSSGISLSQTGGDNGGLPSPCGLFLICGVTLFQDV